MEEIHDFKKETQRYLKLFPVILFMTFVSVGISYLQIAIGLKVFLILAVAAVQGTIAVAYFMHMISEKLFVRILLILTVLNVGGMSLIIYHYYNVPQGSEHVRLNAAPTHTEAHEAEEESAHVP